MLKEDTFGDGQAGRSEEESKGNAFWQSNLGPFSIFLDVEKGRFFEMDKLVDEKKSQQGMHFGNQIRDRFQFFWDVEKGQFWKWTNW